MSSGKVIYEVSREAFRYEVQRWYVPNGWETCLETNWLWLAKFRAWNSATAQCKYRVVDRENNE